ncbi:hypothetical protein ACC696_38680, partial [Rhizobium ruizarguesonis]
LISQSGIIDLVVYFEPIVDLLHGPPEHLVFAISRLVEECYLEIRGRNDQVLRPTMQQIHDQLEVNEEIDHPTLSDENIV